MQSSTLLFHKGPKTVLFFLPKGSPLTTLKKYNNCVTINQELNLAVWSGFKLLLSKGH